MSWTDEMVAELTKLWEEGLTTGEIGKRLGISKNAVVGKAHRLNLQSRPSPIKQSVVKKKKEETKKRIGLLDLTHNMCRWPVGDPKDKDFHFCGKQIGAGGTYCKEHAAQAFVSPSKR